MKAWPDDPLWVVPQFENRISALRASRRALSGAPQPEGVGDGLKKTPHPERERSEQSPFETPPPGGGSSGDAGHRSNFKLRQYRRMRFARGRARFVAEKRLIGGDPSRHPPASQNCRR